MWWTIGGVAGALGVALGAFGAHGLKNIVTDPYLLEVWAKGAHYHQIHALALCAVAAHPNPPARAGWAFVLGITLFSGSLYLMTLTGQRWLGAVTPVGGVAFISGWLILAFANRTP